MERVYNNIIRDHLSTERQMAFITGARQVGKTTLAEKLCNDGFYLNWDDINHSRLIILGPDTVADKFELHKLNQDIPILTFDEIHKYNKWKSFLKGFFDVYQKKCKIIVTGSGRLDIYKKGGDSLMGRYFIYHMHPLSLREINSTTLNEYLINAPIKTSKDRIEQLIKFGGFPEPFLRGEQRFYNRWIKLRIEQLFHEDLRDFSKIQEIKQIEILAQYLTAVCGSQINYSSLSRNINVSVDSIKRWIATLSSLHYCFELRPYSKNIPRTLRKQPKIFLTDWSLVKDIGAKNENFVASHLKKAIDLWNDLGYGVFELFYLRDKDQREVDFLVVKDSEPWFMVEVKTSESKSISKSLTYYHNLLKTKHAFQISFNSDFVDRDCFEEKNPIIVPCSTFLSQLV